MSSSFLPSLRTVWHHIGNIDRAVGLPRPTYYAYLCAMIVCGVDENMFLQQTHTGTQLEL